ncbi:hypothetical protein JZ751_015383 [Albula glossodonta]|uniref:Uncharacterized protein n=1 Tax=Albula glossodonta TaxID=121402 RepID=A0A8T2MXK7_9TELE|nr:hypothetical protein JZ751_015383 [Albula glossodonta]
MAASLQLATSFSSFANQTMMMSERLPERDCTQGPLHGCGIPSPPGAGAALVLPPPMRPEKLKLEPDAEAAWRLEENQEAPAGPDAFRAGSSLVDYLMRKALEMQMGKSVQPGRGSKERTPTPTPTSNILPGFEGES